MISSENTSTTSSYACTDGKTNNPNRPKVFEGNQIKTFKSREESADAMLSNITLDINLKNDTPCNYEKEKSSKNNDIKNTLYSYKGYANNKDTNEKPSLVRSRISDIFLTDSHCMVCKTW